MRNIENALSDHDLITLRVIGEWWEMDLTGADKSACVGSLAEHLSRLDLAAELKFLPPEEVDAMQALAGAGGQMPVGTFSRRFGEVRQMGPGRLEREEPWYDPVSPAEALWYRGFLYRGYDDNETSGALVEYYYLPKEFTAQVPGASPPAEQERTGQDGLQPVQPPASYEGASMRAVDDVTSILSIAQRRGLIAGDISQAQPFLFDPEPDRYAFLVTLAEEMDLLRIGETDLRPTRSAVAWLREEREAQLLKLAGAWRNSRWNELCHTPGIRCEGSGWENDPVLGRTALLEELPGSGAWYRTRDVIERMKEANPDFQRPEGNYDTWYVRDLEDDVYLNGFENWDRVEGRLLQFLIEGPMAWLGLVETGEGRYRLTERALVWLQGEEPSQADVKVPVVVQEDALILVPFNAGRYERFQIARIASPLPLNAADASQPYRFRLSPASLSEAKEDGIRPERVLEFLREASGRPLPASVRRAVERWAENGLEGRLESVVVLRVRDAQILETLQSNPKTRPYVGERLGDLAAIVTAGDWQKLRQATAQLGLLLDAPEKD